MSTKTYYWCSKETAASVSCAESSKNGPRYKYTFPPEFIASRNQKFIVVEECKATFKDQLVGDIILHASFVLRDHYLDHAVCFINEDANRNTAKYEYPSNIGSFEVWFTDLHGNLVDVDGFVLRTLLIY